MDAISDMISDPDRDEFLCVFLDYDVDPGLSDASVYIAWIKPMPCLRTNVTLQQFDEFRRIKRAPWTMR